MSIRSSFTGPETIETFEAAANQKYEAGFELLTSHPGIGVEQIIYAAEMLLKSAYYRFEYVAAGLKPNTAKPISEIERAAAHKLAKLLGVVAKAEGFHNPAYWAELLIKYRDHKGKPLSATLQSDLLHYSKELFDNWFVSMRYHALPSVDQQDLNNVLDAIVWIEQNHTNLWS